MRILGITDHIVSGAAILDGDKVAAAVNEERLVRKKLVMGFPRKSIQAVLEMTNLKPEEIDYVAVATERNHLLNELVEFNEGTFGVNRAPMKELFMSLGSALSGLRDKLPVLEKLYYGFREPAYAYRRMAVRRILREEFGLECPVEFIDHHFAHACSAFYTSGYEDALVVTMDASGDGSSSHVYEVRDGEWRLLHKVSSFDSLGSYYAYVTHICGFTAGKHEGKITGLAAHGDDVYRPIVERFIAYEEGTVRNVGNVFYRSALKKLRSALPAEFSMKDLAATIQNVSEDITTKYVDYWRKKTGLHHVGLAGGLFANVKINQKILQIPGVESVFVHPGMSDEGLAVGATLALKYLKSPSPSELSRTCLDHVYLGPEYSDGYIAEALKANGIEFSQHGNVEEEIARLLSEGYVVARFNGRMEYGPRALGNRSILYRPDDPTVNNWLNRNLKRTEFMPFAPATMNEDAGSLYVGLSGAENTARFMTITFECTREMRDKCPGVVHVDGTARPQLVGPQDNPSFYRILRAFKNQTGLPSIINTSFNIHEEPIVCTPEDAIRAFKIGHLDFLAIGSFIAQNPEPSVSREVIAEEVGVVS